GGGARNSRTSGRRAAPRGTRGIRRGARAAASARPGPRRSDNNEAACRSSSRPEDSVTVPYRKPDARMLTNVPDPTEAWIMVARGDERGIAELALVLIARDLEHRREATPYGWEIWVPVESAPVAVAELDAYRRENARPAAPRPAVDPLDTGWPGARVHA